MSQAIAPSRTSQMTLGMKMSIPALFPGDVIATMSEGKSSEAIRWATNAPFSHATLCVKGGLAVDAMPGNGVTIGKLEKKLLGTARAAVFRHRTATRDQCAFAANWAAGQVGKSYDKIGAARVGLGRGARTRPLQYSPHGLLMTAGDELHGAVVKVGHDGSFFCSELIFRAFEVAGVSIVDTPAHTSGPGQLLTATQLVYMGDLQDLS